MKTVERRVVDMEPRLNHRWVQFLVPAAHTKRWVARTMEQQYWKPQRVFRRQRVQVPATRFQQVHGVDLVAVPAKKRFGVVFCCARFGVTAQAGVQAPPPFASRFVLFLLFFLLLFLLLSVLSRRIV